ncbi:hypothetical protein LAZ67_7002489 [Cordylochernes scorpioides]|uniref:Uncharacterized protein n=1 Tax=Cordylochernes scorpioides TaxID=51811 RepID=A0ABY6KPU6_9ARAC|nr:hypothetical protein LAZ67_7002489 [Cordylochernes scorpioides]
MVRANRRIILEEIEDGLNEDCSHFSVHKIVSETLGYRKVSARWVDKWLKEAAGEWYNTGFQNLKLAEFPLKMIFIKDAQKFQRTDENVQKITDLIKENTRTTLLELEQDTGISKTTIGRIVTKSKRLL